MNYESLGENISFVPSPKFILLTSTAHTLRNVTLEEFIYDYYEDRMIANITI